jgi:hypothetical protein
VDGGVVTNSHVLHPNVAYDAILIRPDDLDPNLVASWVQIPIGEYYFRVTHESNAEALDYAFIEINDPKFNGRHHFEFSDTDDLVAIGEQVLFIGFPFGMFHLTAHLGYVSSIHTTGAVQVLQIDGSVNGGNSGGPMIDLETGRVAGIITRAHKGIVEESFDELIKALRHNAKTLADANKMGGLFIAGVNPAEAVEKSFVAMEAIAENIKRSANVGIGFAFSSKHVRDAIKNAKA